MSDRYKGAILSPTAPTVIPQSAGGVYTLSQQLQYQGQGVWPSAVNNPVNNSLRFRSSASAYLSRTPASAGNQKTWTWSAWVKRGSLTSNFVLFNQGGVSSNYTLARFDSSDRLDFHSYGASSYNFQKVSTAVYRDPSAWYHIVFVLDATNTQARIYVNGSEVTYTTNTNPSNADQPFNQAVLTYIGAATTPLQYFDGYLAEVNFIDGQALTPSSFGTTDAYGIWQPIPYTGTYGTNGFYLPFTDNSALTTSSNVGLGKDFSGNGNYWVTNNISITAGSTYDSMKDVPTNTNSNTANYCTLNPLDQDQAGLSVTLSNGNLTASGSSYGVSVYRCTFQVPQSGKWYWESVYTAITSTVIVGIRSYSTGSTDVQYRSDGQKIVGSTTSAYGASWTTNDVIGIAVDRDAGTVTFYKNNSSQGVINIPTNSAAFDIAFNTASPYGSTTVNVNFGQRPFSYTPPSGFYPLNTYNLPTPTILDGDQYFNAVLYSGNNSTQNIAVGFQPDFVWSKCRNVARSHRLSDAVRGSTRDLYSDATSAEQNDGSITSFISTGFSLNNATGSAYNTSGENYVSWSWRASNAAGVSNTQGTITSTVSANTTAGFSIATYTGTGANATVGHGLGVAPSMVIVKRRDSGASPWNVWHTSLTSGTYFLVLSSTAAQASGATRFTTLPTSTVFSIGTDSDLNASGGTYVAYCFSAVAGYSAFGSYTGNSSTDGPFIYTGFRPRFVLWKNITQASQWILLDTACNTYNVANAYLEPNTADTENTANTVFDMLSNGFKLRNGGGTDYNENANTYIYMAFAENPFKIANAR